ncbi:hypothetical protein ACC691_40610, partial [Rhizobium johnstonii]|uniref:hypothetical protein n=1 Tax=Rhizobium johnstonii TaxID=3019933 RepID=UPI003F9D0D9F
MRNAYPNTKNGSRPKMRERARVLSTLPPRVLWRWRAGAIAVFFALALTVALSIGWLRDVHTRLFLLYDDS